MVFRAIWWDDKASVIIRVQDSKQCLPSPFPEKSFSILLLIIKNVINMIANKFALQFHSDIKSIIITIWQSWFSWRITAVVITVDSSFQFQPVYILILLSYRYLNAPAHLDCEKE